MENTLKLFLDEQELFYSLQVTLISQSLFKKILLNLIFVDKSNHCARFFRCILIEFVLSRFQRGSIVESTTFILLQMIEFCTTVGIYHSHWLYSSEITQQNILPQMLNLGLLYILIREEKVSSYKVLLK